MINDDTLLDQIISNVKRVGLLERDRLNANRIWNDSSRLLDGSIISTISNDDYNTLKTFMGNLGEAKIKASDILHFFSMSGFLPTKEYFLLISEFLIGKQPSLFCWL